MFKKWKSSLATISIIVLIGLLSFKDTGIFVQDYVAQGEGNSEVYFKTEELVNILSERDRDYIVEKNLQKYYIPKEVVLRIESNINLLKVKEPNTLLMDKPGGEKIKDLSIGDNLEVVNLQGDYAKVIIDDNLKGYALIKNLEEGDKEKATTIGTAQVNKTLKGNNNTYYVLLKGEPVLITDFSKGEFTIVDEAGKEFKAHKDYISLRNSRHATSRSIGLAGRTSKINAVVSHAFKALGAPYKSAATGKGGYDCSGLTYSLYLNSAGIKLNRSSKDQIKNGIAVNKSELAPGDLVFFRTWGAGIGHVGLYIGDGDMIHASSGQKKVIITPIDQAWYKARYVGARRIIK